MKRGLKFLVIIGFLLSTIHPVHSLTLLNENFTGQTISPSGAHINLITPQTTDDNLGKWIDFSKWAVFNDGTNSYARHSVTSDETNLLYYGIDVSALSLNGAAFNFEFDYIAENRKPERVVLAGMKYGLHELDPYAPWLSPADLTSWPYTPDGIPFVDLAGATALETTSDWRHITVAGVIPDDYDVIVVAFAFGGTSQYKRAVDNVNLSVSVPEPGLLLLLGSGLLGIFGLKRKLS